MGKELYAKRAELSALSEQVANKANAEHTHQTSDITNIEDITGGIDSAKKVANQALSKAGQAYEIAISFKNPIVIKGRVDSVGDLPNESSNVPPIDGWIYFVGEKSTESSYEEYIYMDNHWELIGTTSQGVDLSNIKISDLIDDTTQENYINWAGRATYAPSAGNAMKASTAEGIEDHSSVSNKIYINYTGDGLGTDNIKYVAAFDSSGNIGKATVSNLVSKIREENDFVQIRKVSTENTINFNSDFLLDQPDDPIKVIFDCSSGTNNYNTVGAPPLKNNAENAPISFIMTVEKIYNVSSYSLKQHCIVFEINNMSNATISEYKRYKLPTLTPGVDRWTEWKSTKAYVPIVSIPYVEGENIDLNDYTLYSKDPAKAIYEGSTYRPIAGIVNCPASMNWSLQVSFLLTVERINVHSDYINKDIVKQHIVMYGTGANGQLADTKEFVRYSYRNASENTLEWTGWEEVNVIDSTLSDNSENPVQNKIITSELNKKLDILSRNYIPIREIDSSVDFNTSFNLSEIDPDITVFTRNEGYVDSHGPIGSESLSFILIVERLYEKTNLYDKYYRQHYIGLSHMDTEQIKIVEYERIVKLNIMTGVYEFGVWKSLKVDVDTDLSGTSLNPVQNKAIVEALSKQITSPTEGRVGQLLAVESVDENNKPTSWKTVGVADISTDITVDETLSTTSTNPVQNKVVTTEINKRITSPTSSSVNQLLAVETVDSNRKPTSWTTIDGAPKIVQEYMEGGSGYLPVLLGEDAFEYDSGGNAVKENKTCAAKRNPAIVYHPNSGTLKVSKLEGTASNATNADRATTADSATTAEEATAIQQNFIMQSPNAYPLLGSADSDLTQSNITGTPYKFHGLTFTPTSGTLSVRVVDASEFTGKAATAGKADRATSADSATQADKATALIDYTDTGTTVQVGYSGGSVSTDDATYVAVYTNGAHIKDMSFDSLASKLTSSSNFRPIQYSTSGPGSSLTTGTIWIQYES